LSLLESEVDGRSKALPALEPGFSSLTTTADALADFSPLPLLTGLAFDSAYAYSAACFSSSAASLDS
jgi:hypothetical protein